MLGQLKLFKEVALSSKLRNRISVGIIPTTEANTIVKSYHYLKRKRTGSRLLAHGIFLDNEMVGCLIYADPTFIKKKGLIPPLEQGEVIELARLWLDDKAPKHSESCALGKSLKRIAEDWEHKYGIAIKAIVSFSDERYSHQGIVYKAANFEDFGYAPMARLDKAGEVYPRENEGWGAGHYRRRNTHTNEPRSKTIKRCYVFWLER